MPGVTTPDVVLTGQAARVSVVRLRLRLRRKRTTATFATRREEPLRGHAKRFGGEGGKPHEERRRDEQSTHGRRRRPGLT